MTSAIKAVIAALARFGLRFRIALSTAKCCGRLAVRPLKRLVNRIEVRKLRLGLETANFIEVLSGLQPGDLVVIGNRGVLQPGERVRPKITTIGDGS